MMVTKKLLYISENRKVALLCRMQIKRTFTHGTCNHVKLTDRDLPTYSVKTFDSALYEYGRLAHIVDVLTDH